MIVTLGVEGSIYYDGTAVKKIPAIKAEVVDTTGEEIRLMVLLLMLSQKEKRWMLHCPLQRLLQILSVQRFGAQGACRVWKK